MAFITYVLLAGMALGIQQRLVLTSLLAYLPSSIEILSGSVPGPSSPTAALGSPAPGWLTLTHLLPWLQVLPRGVGPVCEHSTGVGVNGGAGPASGPLPGHRTQ